MVGLVVLLARHVRAGLDLPERLGVLLRAHVEVRALLLRPRGSRRGLHLRGDRLGRGLRLGGLPGVEGLVLAHGSVARLESLVEGAKLLVGWLLHRGERFLLGRLNLIR